MIHTTQLVYLLRKYLDGTLSADEEEQLRLWADSDPAYRRLLDEIHDEDSLRAKLLAFDAVPANEAVWENPKIWERIRPANEQRETGIWRSRMRWVYRAAAVLLVSLSVYFATVVRKQGTLDNESLQAGIAPGGNKAVLTLANGRVVILDSAQTGIIVKADELTYSDGSKIPSAVDAEPEAARHMLQVVTPRGGQYQVILGDGTKVWLNAATTLRYPSRFSGANREVEIDGEGFFSVASRQASTTGNTPFVVRSRGQVVRVLGTEFNIRSYNDELTVRTTLASGAVQVLSDKGSREDAKILKPGEQSSLSKEGTLTKKEVDISSELAWTKGKFSFNNKSFGQVMTELARWYDLELSYEDGVPEQKFFGEAYRDNNLAIVLKLLKSADIAYRIEGKKLIINNKK